jgi:mannose-6-phosphate isomerase-like protein (cupin superfamily)
MAGTFVPAGDGETVWFLTNRITIKATAETTGGAYGLFESLIAPGSSPPLQVHHLEDEAFWVLDGELTMVCGEETFTASRGAPTRSCPEASRTRSSSRATGPRACSRC